MNIFLILCFLSLSSILYAQVDHQKEQELTFWQWNLPSNSYQIHYIEKGTGPNHILLIHGFAAHSYTWRFTIDALAQAGYHVWAIDLLGSGLSDKPIDVPYGTRLFTHQIDAFMQAKQIDCASLVGNSMGGALALVMAIDHPHRVQSLILIDALAFPINLPFYFAVTKALGQISKPWISKTMVKQILKQVLYDSNKISEEQVEAYYLPLQTPEGKNVFIKTLQNFNSQELEGLSWHFSEIQVPILLIWGEKDIWIPVDHFRQLSQLFPLATAVLIPNCGHIPQEECPVEVNQALLQFLKEN